MLRRLRIKFICINMVIVTVMLVVISGMVIHFTRADLVKESVQSLKIIATAQKPSGALKTPGLRQERSTTVPFFVLLVKSDGELLSARSDYYDVSDDVFLQELADLTLASDSETGTLSEYALRYYRTNMPNAAADCVYGYFKRAIHHFGTDSEIAF